MIVKERINNMKRLSGFTLIEIMIALLLGLIVVGSILTIYIATVQGSSDTVKAARLNHDLEAAMALMINDIRRAGYWGDAIKGSNAVENPYTTGIANIQIMDYTDANGDTHANGCVLYSYDADGSGNYDSDDDGVVDNDQEVEFLGFRLDRGVIWIRASGITNGDCDNDGDNDGVADADWQRLMDQKDVLVTGLTFSSANYECLHIRSGNFYNSNCASAQVTAAGTADTSDDFTAGDRVVETRQIDIVLTGQLVSDPTVQKTLSDIVKVRNDRHAEI